MDLNILRLLNIFVFSKHLLLRFLNLIMLDLAAPAAVASVRASLPDYKTVISLNDDDASICPLF